MSNISAQRISPACQLCFILLWECLASSGHWREGHCLIRPGRSRLCRPAGSPLRSGCNQSKLRLGTYQRGLHGVCVLLLPDHIKTHHLIAQSTIHYPQKNFITSPTSYKHKSVVIIPIWVIFWVTLPPPTFSPNIRNKVKPSWINFISLSMEQSLCYFTRLPELNRFPEHVIASLSGCSTPTPHPLHLLLRLYYIYSWSII